MRWTRGHAYLEKPISSPVLDCQTSQGLQTDKCQCGDLIQGPTICKAKIETKIGAQDALLQLDGAAREDEVGTWQHILFSAPVR
jgi:hypothetical protein